MHTHPHTCATVHTDHNIHLGTWNVLKSTSRLVWQINQDKWLWICHKCNFAIIIWCVCVCPFTTLSVASFLWEYWAHQGCIEFALRLRPSTFHLFLSLFPPNRTGILSQREGQEAPGTEAIIHVCGSDSFPDRSERWMVCKYKQSKHRMDSKLEARMPYHPVPGLPVCWTVRAARVDDTAAPLFLHPDAHECAHTSDY